jgi:hypothetical protein
VKKIMSAVETEESTVSAIASIPAINRELAERVNAEARRDPHSPYAGKFVGIAIGQVVAVADSWREISRRLREVEPDPGKCCCIEASADYDAVHEVFRFIRSV